MINSIFYITLTLRSDPYLNDGLLAESSGKMRWPNENTARKLACGF